MKGQTKEEETECEIEAQILVTETTTVRLLSFLFQAIVPKMLLQSHCLAPALLFAGCDEARADHSNAARAGFFNHRVLLTHLWSKRTVMDQRCANLNSR